MGLDIVLTDLNKGVDPENALDLACSFPITAKIPKEIENEAYGVKADSTCTN